MRHGAFIPLGLLFLVIIVGTTSHFLSVRSTDIRSKAASSSPLVCSPTIAPPTIQEETIPFCNTGQVCGTPSPIVTPTPTVQSVIPNPPAWFLSIPLTLKNFLEQLYLTVHFFKLPSNLEHLLEGLV